MEQEQILALIDALKKGDLDYIKELSISNPDWLTALLAHDEKQGLNALHYASQYGQLELVQFLLNEYPDLLNAANAQNQTPLDYAMKNHHYSVANALILKITANQNKDAILPFIHSGTQALEMMVQEPSLIEIFLEDDRIVHLINSTQCNISQKSISWYNAAGRRPSFFAHIDTEAGTSAVFNPVKHLGKGTSGLVRLFSSADGQDIAVKSLNEDVTRISQSELLYQKKALQRESQFMKNAYPDDNLTETFEFLEEKNGKKTYNNRQVMHFAEGETAKVFTSKIMCPLQLAKIIYTLAMELNRLHSGCSIIHGDIQKNNIIINHNNSGFIVRFIDFGMSHYTDDYTRIILMGESHQWYAPELFTSGVRAHAKQDIYSLGHLLNSILDAHPAREPLMQSFPSIRFFIKASQNINPKKRPSLAFFCGKLNYELFLINELAEVAGIANQRVTNYQETRNYPSKLSVFGVRENKVTSPRALNALTKMAADSKYSREEIKSVAQQFLMWSKTKHRHFNKEAMQKINTTFKM